LGERLLCKQEVIGSIPFTSTRRVFRQTRHGTTDTAPKSAVLFFDMVKRECVKAAVSCQLSAISQRAKS
jgi:hypothetical protein